MHFLVCLSNDLHVLSEISLHHNELIAEQHKELPRLSCKTSFKRAIDTGSYGISLEKGYSTPKEEETLNSVPPLHLALTSQQTLNNIVFRNCMTPLCRRNFCVITLIVILFKWNARAFALHACQHRIVVIFVVTNL